MALEQISGPAAEPITLAELKDHCKIQHTALDSWLPSLIKAMRARAENYLEGPIVERSYRQTIDAFPEVQIELLVRPVSAIASVKYFDPAGVQQTLASPNYTLDKRRLPDWLLPAYGASWPETLDAANAVSIEFVAGWPAASVPEDIKLWLKMTAAFVVKNPEAMVLDGKVGEIPARWIDSMLDPYRAFKA